MHSLFNQTDVSVILKRIESLDANTQRKWGKMSVAQMLAHTNISLETAMGMNTVKPVFFIGRMIGSMLKPVALSEKPFGKNSPTAKNYIFNTDLNLEEERSKLKTSVQNFFDGGPSKVTKQPHPFFGNFTPEQWAVFQWKHLDHHLRQFGV
ncbi:MAG TPA: DUF1569 domain-containing protein [Ferruginibacter sp.]|jgi:hypothetical protein|nr:DUF1569 domain-containing protein [Ferruginibacter sp.]